MLSSSSERDLAVGILHALYTHGNVTVELTDHRVTITSEGEDAPDARVILLPPLLLQQRLLDIDTNSAYSVG